MDDGATWNNLSAGLQIGQIFRLGQNIKDGGDIICGFQDNGTNELFRGNWFQAFGGDGMECIIDPSNGNIEYASTFSGVLWKTINGFKTMPTVIAPSTPNPGAWVTPYVIDPNNNKILYAGYQSVWKTIDQGATWAALSTYNLVSQNLISLAIAPSNSQKIYTASYDTLFFTNNGGGSWFYVPISHITGNTADRITYIAIKPTDPQTLWITISGYHSGDKVFESTNGGISFSWVNISGTLPNVPANCIVYENGSKDGLYIGTDLGVYYKDSSMTNWISYNTSLPHVPVTELEIHYLVQKIRAATYGRGLWESDLYKSSLGIQNYGFQNSINIYPNPNKGLFNVSFYNPLDFQTTLEIFNIVGEKIIQKSFSLNNIEIKLFDQSDGIYFVRLTNKDGTVTKKIIIEK